jgi:hypothetical protein
VDFTEDRDIVKHGLKPVTLTDVTRITWDSIERYTRKSSKDFRISYGIDKIQVYPQAL